ncbi:MAG: ATP phosphoribosyltransferase [Verrucomicrobia bacterium]|nr:ATP phosphoribosyltransferase [Verrucomicrobiota bacterium]
MASPLLRLGLPSGSLHEATVDLFAKAGYQITGTRRSYKPAIDDPELELRLLRAQEISRYVEAGFLDGGLTGKDWVEENDSDVEVLARLEYSKATSNPTRWVLVVPENSPVRSVHDLAGKRIATEAVGLTRKFLQRHGVSAVVEFSWGSTEAKVPELVDAIVDITETGTSLQANHLRVVEVLTESYPLVIANRAAMRDAWKRAKLERLVLLLHGALNARNKVGLKMNLPEGLLPRVLALLPSLRNPTVSPLSQAGWAAIETVIDEKVVREIIPQLKALGAEGIIEYPLNKVVY